MFCGNLFVQIELISTFFQWKWKTTDCCLLSSLFFCLRRPYITFSFSSLWQKTAFLQMFLNWCFPTFYPSFYLLWTHQEIFLETLPKTGHSHLWLLAGTVSPQVVTEFMISNNDLSLLVSVIILCIDLLFSKHCTLSMSSINLSLWFSTFFPICQNQFEV